MAHFKITGEYLTNLARTRYADDGEPEGAVRLLEAAFPEMEPSTRLAILTGSKKLVGDEHGMELEDDHAACTEMGMPLDLTQTVSYLRQELDEYKDAVALKAHMTTDFASPFGLVQLPTRKAEAYRSGKLTLDQIPHVETDIERRSTYETHFIEPNPQGPLPAPSVKVDPQPKITSNNGWLSPDGTFYPCGYSEHNALAEELCQDTLQIEKMGWVKLATTWQLSVSDTSQPRDLILPGDRPPTQAQIDRIFDWLGELPATIKLAMEDSSPKYRLTPATSSVINQLEVTRGAK